MPEDPALDRHYALIGRLTSRGPDSLSDVELLTLLFGGCVPIAKAADRAREYTEELGPANTIVSLDLTELTFFEGIGEAKAAAVVAGVELGRRSIR
ncbi:MAG: hypothetical protein KKB90_03530 [Actinobacteria bacterium]|nr:hypothetical protein [Actinomycetota bacterium]MCG2819262.1 hypothetical protein [Actinomycetes bacterium]MBU4179044.1 hypothetical protein [Actinomycetota bacterium]MBU4218017.1 hypothetical protein [Actinomycetota bacterium]MBU4359362.1 hypothetical protein [Actinomycetota bacterium]